MFLIDLPLKSPAQKSIQKTLMQYHLSLPITYSIEHNMHCLDTLREDTICHADDTPRYTTNATEPVSGIGQKRQCRDWNRLEVWVKHFEGCWRYLDESANQRVFTTYRTFMLEDPSQALEAHSLLRRKHLLPLATLPYLVTDRQGLG